jgi:hypothetical protein
MELLGEHEEFRMQRKAMNKMFVSGKLRRGAVPPSPVSVTVPPSSACKREAPTYHTLCEGGTVPPSPVSGTISPTSARKRSSRRTVPPEMRRGTVPPSTRVTSIGETAATPATSDRVGGTVPPSTPEKSWKVPRNELLRGTVPSQTSQTGTQLPKEKSRVLPRGREGGEATRRSELVKSMSNEPRDNLGSRNLHENARKGEPLIKFAEVRKSKVGNLKLFWENRGGIEKDDITTPKFCGPNRSGTVPENIVIANHKSSPGTAD